MDIFFDKRCTIYTTTILTVDCEETKSYVAVYTDIACDYFTPNNKYNSNNQAREFE
jgi:hypothetical protein